MVDLNAVLSPQDCIEISTALSTRGKHDKSLAVLDFCLEKEPGSVVAMVNKGSSLVHLKRADEAKVLLAKAIEMEPNNAGAWFNMGAAHQYDLELDEARLCFEVALSKNPLFAADLHCSIAMNCLLRGDYDEALKQYGSGLRLVPGHPGLIFSQSFVHMIQGNWKAGLPAYEARLAMRSIKTVPGVPVWNLQSPGLAGKSVLLLSEQGAGDMIQFARYAALLKASLGVASVSLLCSEEQAPLLSLFPAIDSVTTIPAIGAHVDVQIPIMSLPYVFHLAGVKWDVPPPTAYIRNTFGKVIKIPKSVGFCWRGNPTHGNDRFRSLTIDQAAKLGSMMRQEGYTVIPMQKDRTEEEISVITRKGRVFAQGDWRTTAEELLSLDLVVSVDTAIAHLAATLGIPTVLMLPANPDWRWQLTGDKTPFYPEMLIVRQKKLGEWDEVFERVAGPLQ